MNFFRSVFSDDPDPSTTTSESKSKSPQKSSPKEESSSSSPSDPSSSVADSSAAAAGAWSFGIGLIKTLSARSESVIETYRRDLQEFGSGLKKEIEVAQGSLDEIGTSVLKGTVQIIAKGKDAILAVDHESDNDSSSNQNFSNHRNSSSKPYSRFDVQVSSIQGDSSTYCEEPDDVGDYENWKLKFVLDDKREEIENLLQQNVAIDNIHRKVVPDVVDDETFWFRYFYKVYKLKLAENVRANLVKRAIASEEEEDLSWDVDDDDDEDEEVGVGSKGDAVKEEVNVGETVKEENAAIPTLMKEEVNVGESVKEENAAIPTLMKEEVDGKESADVVKKEVTVGDVNVEELDGDKGSDQKVHLESGSGLNNKDQGLMSNEKVAAEAKSDHGESSKDSDISIVSTQPSMMPEDEDLGWDEIEDLSIIEEKKAVTQAGVVNREEMRKRLSTGTAEDDEDLDWGSDTE